MATYDLQIQGMTCGGCVKHVREALANVVGVRNVEVEIGHARVETGPDVEEAALVKAVADADYEVVKTTRACGVSATWSLLAIGLRRAK